MWLIDLIALMGVVAYTEWRIRGLKFTAPATQQLSPPPTFVCYYCGAQFPLSERELIGPYEYCPAHGSKRKEEFLAGLKLPAPVEGSNGNTHSGVRAADRWSELGDHGKLPWVS